VKAVMRQGPGKVHIADRPKPVPQYGELLIKVGFTGICGSDMHRLMEDRPQWDSLILGHEFSGKVEFIAEGVSEVAVGDKVTAAPLLPCHHCDFCARGEFSLCTDYTFIGSRIDGSFSEYVLVPESNVVSLGEGFPLEKGIFVEPLTVCLHPILRLGNLLGSTVAVTGLGTIGLLAAQVFKRLGARHVIASDIIPEKLAMALTMGATKVVNIGQESLEDELDKLGGADVVFESSGSNPAKLSAIRIARGRGTVILVGTSSRDITFDAALFERITRKELIIVGSWMNYSSPWPGPEWATAVWMIQSGQIDTDPLTTHRFTLDEFQNGLDIIASKKEPFVKIMIVPDANP